jgi:hypothetical protein
MIRSFRRCWRGRAASGLALAAVALAAAPLSSALAVTAATGVPAQVPSLTMPKIIDGEVDAITQVGNTMVVGGTFLHTKTTWSQTTAASHPYIFAFDATTGAVSAAFAPVLDGAVLTLAPGPDGQSVYVGGQFNNVNGVKSKSLALLSLSTGKAVAGFKAPPTNGIVNELRTDASFTHLYLGGTFTILGGQARGGLGSLSPTTGAVDGALTISVSGHHNYGKLPGTKIGATGVKSFDISGNRLVLIGNFDTVAGLPRDQIAVANLNGAGGTVDPNWATSQLSAPCSPAFDSWVRMVRFSADGSYFVVASSGGQASPTLSCDAATRFESAPGGQNVPPTWIASTGQDTLWSVAMTPAAIYLGGHERWLNNPSGHNLAGPGAVARPGIAAVDPATGLPLAWNPGRHPRGIGAKALFVSPTGLWVGADQEYYGLTAQGKTGAYHTGRLAYFPLATGTNVNAPTPTALPATIYTASGKNLVAHSYNGTSVGAGTTLTATGLDWSTVRSAFFLGGRVYYSAGGALHARTFNGTTLGPDTLVNPYSTAWDNVLTGDAKNPNVTYAGMPPSFYGKLTTLTGVAYAGGRIFYTVSGSSKLFYRSFVADSGVIGALEYSLPSSLFGGASGLFISGNTLYVAVKSTGKLESVAFNPGSPSAAPTIGGLATVATGTSGVNWTTTSMFLAP